MKKSAIILANAALVILWLFIYRPVFPYLAVIFSREEFRTNQIVLLGATILIVLQVRKGDLQLSLDALPQRYPPALALALGGSSLFLLVERTLDINTLSASLFGLASYGLLGLWMSPPHWRGGLPAALLIIGALPFGEHMQTFVGYPVRILTAGIVREGLAAMGVHTVGVDTILVFESGISKVDLPCSGVKSLWTGGLFWLAATWIERRPIHLRWFLAAVGFAVLLLAANLGRVAVLVLVGQVAGWRLLAEMLHVPLGVLGFIGACATAVVLLRRLPAVPGDKVPGLAASVNGLPRPLWLAPVLGGVFLFMALLYTPRSQVALAQSSPTWRFPAEMGAELWPMTRGEREWLAEGGADSVERWRFQWRGHTGSMLFVTSTTWRAQHQPERCFQVYGLTIEQSYTHLVGPGFPIRLLSLSNGSENVRLSAAYWLQTADQATDDYATRIWADLGSQRQRWILVTIMFDEAVDPRLPEAEALYNALHSVVQNSLAGGAQP